VILNLKKYSRCDALALLKQFNNKDIAAKELAAIGNINPTLNTVIGKSLSLGPSIVTIVSRRWTGKQ